MTVRQAKLSNANYSQRERYIEGGEREREREERERERERERKRGERGEREREGREREREEREGEREREEREGRERERERRERERESKKIREREFIRPLEGENRLHLFFRPSARRSHLSSHPERHLIGPRGSAILKQSHACRTQVKNQNEFHQSHLLAAIVTKLFCTMDDKQNEITLQVYSYYNNNALTPSHLD